MGAVVGEEPVRQQERTDAQDGKRIGGDDERGLVQQVAGRLCGQAFEDLGRHQHVQGFSPGADAGYMPPTPSRLRCPRTPLWMCA